MMFVDAFMLAALSLGGILMLYSKFPPRLRAFIEKHYILTDLILFVATYAFLGGTLTAMLASALVDIFISILLYVAAHKERFSDLYKLKRTLDKKFDELVEGLNGVARSINLSCENS